MTPGETDSDKKTVSFDIYDSSGLPASGEGGEGSVATVSAGDLQISYNYGSSYANAAGAFAHGGDGTYIYVFDDDEVSSGIGEKNIWLRYKKTGYRTRIVEVQLRYSEVIVDTTLSTSAVAKISDAIFANAHREGRTFLGFLRRADSLFFGEITGLNDTTVTGKAPGGVTDEFTVDQDIPGGTREEADVSGSET